MNVFFEKETALIPETVEWSFNKSSLTSELQNMISEFSSYPLLVIGSGGSLSCAQFISC